MECQAAPDAPVTSSTNTGFVASDDASAQATDGTNGGWGDMHGKVVKSAGDEQEMMQVANAPKRPGAIKG